MADEPQLEKGESGEWVQYLQQLLQSAGRWTSDANGTFGDELEQAVTQFQSDHGLSADGVVGASTWAALTGQSADAPASADEQSTQAAATSSICPPTPTVVGPVVVGGHRDILVGISRIPEVLRGP